MTASVQGMSSRSPTFTSFNASLSTTRELYFQLFGPDRLMDGIFGSIAVIVAVIARCDPMVNPGFAPGVGISDSARELTSFSPFSFTRRTMLS